MAEIRFISTSVIQPAVSQHSESSNRIELTPWDLQYLLVGPIQKGLLFLKPTPSQEKLVSNTVVDHLKISFSRTLEFFPPLAGRLGIIKKDDKSSFFIDCNNAGAHFIHAVLDDINISDIVDPIQIPRVVHCFFPMNEVVSNYEGISKPLLAVQVTELVDGFFIGCTMNHTVVDGSSFWQFFNTWSEISRGFENPSRFPLLTRWFPSDIDCPVRIPSQSIQVDDKFVLPSLEERIFHFPKAKIAALKAQANSEMNTNSISSLQALLAHLWRSLVRCQNIGADEEVKYKIFIGARPRLKPSLPEGYFGNAVHCETVTTTAGELLEQGLGWAAWQINKVIALQTKDEIENFFKGWVDKPNLITMSGFTKAKNALSISSSPRFNVYGNDFGWGKPVAVRSGLANKIDGKVTLFPGVEEGSVDIEICCLFDKLVALGNDKEFMEAVAI